MNYSPISILSLILSSTPEKSPLLILSHSPFGTRIHASGSPLPLCPAHELFLEAQSPLCSLTSPVPLSSTTCQRWSEFMASHSLFVRVTYAKFFGSESPDIVKLKNLSTTRSLTLSKSPCVGIPSQNLRRISPHSRSSSYRYIPEVST